MFITSGELEIYNVKFKIENISQNLELFTTPVDYSISNTFFLALCPESRAILLLLTWKYLASALITASFALPSRGGSLT